MAGGVAEPVDGHVIPASDGLARADDLLVQLGRVERDQVGVADALRVELPAGLHQSPDLGVGQAALRRRQPGQLDVLIRHPAEPAQHRKRCGVLRVIAVVEGDDDRLAGRELGARRPVGPQLIERDRVPAVVLERLHLGRELRGKNVEPGERRAGGRRSDHVVHEHRDGGVAGPAVAGGQARRGRAPGCRSWPVAAARVAAWVAVRVLAACVPDDPPPMAEAITTTRTTSTATSAPPAVSRRRSARRRRCAARWARRRWRSSSSIGDRAYSLARQRVCGSTAVHEGVRAAEANRYDHAAQAPPPGDQHRPGAPAPGPGAPRQELDRAAFAGSTRSSWTTSSSGRWPTPFAAMSAPAARWRSFPPPTGATSSAWPTRSSPSTPACAATEDYRFPPARPTVGPPWRSS